jgi:hypothetical protein
LLNLLDNLDYAASAGINKHRSIIDNGVAILAGTIFLGNVVVGYARFRKLSAHPHVALVPVGRAVLLNYIAAEARPLINSQYSGHTTDDPSDRATDDSARRTCRAVAFAGTSFDAARHTLGRCGKWNNYSRGQNRRSKNLTDHLEPPVRLKKKDNRKASR